MGWFTRKTKKKKVSLGTSYRLWKKRGTNMIHQRLENEGANWIIIKFFIPIQITLIGLFLIYYILDNNEFWIVGKWMVVYYFPPFGKEWAIPGAIAEGIPPFEIALAIAFLDIVTALFLLWNYDFAKMMPVFGKWMEKAEKKGQKTFKKHPWWENLAFIGVVLFIMFPFQGSGGVGASVLGRVIGVNKYKILLAISIGAISGCLAIAYLGNAIINIFRNDLLWGLILLIVVAVILGIYNIYIRMKR